VLIFLNCFRINVYFPAGKLVRIHLLPVLFAARACITGRLASDAISHEACVTCDFGLAAALLSATFVKEIWFGHDWDLQPLF
jgi:uncharacterized membrane protein